MTRVAVVGSLNFDLMAYVEHLPRPGEAVHAHTILRVAGGKGFNQAVAARRLGAAVHLVGAVGADEFGREFEQVLDAHGIDRSGVARAGLPTGFAVPVVDGAGENTIVVAPGANLAVGPADVERILPPADVVMVQGEMRPETSLRALQLASGLRVLNAAPASEGLYPLLAEADVTILNEAEEAAMGGTAHLERLGARSVVVTLGASGARVGGRLVAAPAVRAIDTTGAGDAFCAALAISLAEGAPLEAAVAWANLAGAAACLRAGSSSSMPTRGELESLRGAPERHDG